MAIPGPDSDNFGRFPASPLAVGVPGSCFSIWCPPDVIRGLSKGLHMSLVRITGKAGLVTARTVTSNKEATKGQQFTFHNAAVIVADSGVADLSFDPSRDGRTFAYGDAVDVLAEATAFGGRVQLSYVSDYPAVLKTAEAEAVLASA